MSGSPQPEPSCSPDEIPNLMPDKGWQRRFDDPIPLPRGRQLVTLKDAAGYIMKLPKAEQNLEEWQTTTGCLIGAAEGRDFVMLARIGVLRAQQLTESNRTSASNDQLPLELPRSISLSCNGFGLWHTTFQPSVGLPGASCERWHPPG
jgi:hypothetical protein